MALITNLQVVLNATLTKTPGLTIPTTNIPVNIAIALADGTTAGKADRLYAATRTIAASSNDDLDLAGVLADDFGQTITFARIKALWVRGAAANVNNVVLGAAAANPWVTLLNATGTATLRPGALVLAAAGVADATGYAVTGGTGDILRVANGGAGTSVSYDIALVGCSA